MKPLTYYANLSEDTATAINEFDRGQLLGLIQEIAGELLTRNNLDYYIPLGVAFEIDTLKDIQCLGLIKGLTNLCETKIAKKQENAL